MSEDSNPWEVRAAWLLRALIVASAVFHVVEGKFLYALLCAAVIAVLVVPLVLARSSRANMPVEIELVALWAAVGDMTLGRVVGLYEGPWFDKLLHFSTSLLIGVLAFIMVYALRFTGRLCTSSAVNAIVIFLLALGVGALWEIAEYAADLAIDEGAQGSPAMTPLDDTMWDLILDGAGGILGAGLGSLYIRWSRRSKERIVAFAALVPSGDCRSA